MKIRIFYLEEVVVQVVVCLLNEATTPSSVTLQQQYKQRTKAVHMKVLLTSRQDDIGELDRVSFCVHCLSLCCGDVGAGS
jgi:hypothetical protein